MKYVRAAKPKSQLYVESLPLFTRGLISIPDHARLTRELRLLERRTHRSGKDSVDHGRNGSDDYANVVCGVAVNVGARGYISDLSWVDGETSGQSEAERNARLRKQRFVSFVMSGRRFPGM